MGHTPLVGQTNDEIRFKLSKKFTLPDCLFLCTFLHVEHAYRLPFSKHLSKRLGVSRFDCTSLCDHKHRQNVFQFTQLVSAPSSKLLVLRNSALAETFETDLLSYKSIENMANMTMMHRVHHPFAGGRRTSAPGRASAVPQTK